MHENHPTSADYANSAAQSALRATQSATGTDRSTRAFHAATKECDSLTLKKSESRREVSHASHCGNCGSTLILQGPPPKMSVQPDAITKLIDSAFQKERIQMTPTTSSTNASGLFALALVLGFLIALATVSGLIDRLAWAVGGFLMTYANRN